jgi:tetratricopeptide (TPR) repeat protein
MTSSLSRFAYFFTATTIALLFSSRPSRAQDLSRDKSATIEGKISDQQNHGLSDAEVILEDQDKHGHLAVRTDSQGEYRFTSLSPGNYTVRVTLPGWREVKKGPLTLQVHQAMSLSIQLERDQTNPELNKNAAQGLEFSDEPNFTVAGITDPTNLGGHGSDVILRTKESLAKATVSLNAANLEEDKRRVEMLRTAPDSAELHVLLGEISESEGRPLDAVREYQRAAEMDSSEANLFAWGAELLLHRAFEPASEVFAKGHRLFPSSSRVLVGMGVTSYALGRTDAAAQQLAAACDLNPSDAMPYVFLGKMQNAEKIEPPGWTARLKRFASMHPENATAHYYYAVALTKDFRATESSAAIESSLVKAVELDPHFGDAYLQLGILYAKRKSFVKAEDAYGKAIANTALPDEAHFRLAEVYRLTGDRAKAHDQIVLYEQLSKQKTQDSERERHEVQQFVYTLRQQSNATPQPQ